MNKAILGIAVILLMLLFPSYAVSLDPNQNFAQAANQQQPKPAPIYSPSGTPLPIDKWNLWLRSQLGVLSTPVALHLAGSLGVDQLNNKPINQATPATNLPRPALPNGLNTPIYGYYYVSSEPSIAFNPRDPTEGYAVFATK